MSFAFVALLALVVVGGALIDFGIGLLISTAAFWFVQVDALRWIVLQLEQEFTRYPLSIYGRGVRLLLAFVIPFGFMNYFPASYFLQKADNGLGLPLAVGVLTPAIGARVRRHRLRRLALRAAALSGRGSLSRARAARVAIALRVRSR